MPKILMAVGLAAALSGQTRKPLIGVGGIVHETNTFNPKKTTLADFEAGIGGAHGILRGAAVIEESRNANNTVAGFIAGAEESGLELFPTVVAGPQTIGMVTADAFNSLTQELSERLQAPGAGRKLDGVLLFLHGTMVAEGHPHGDAEVVRRVRKALGETIPIIVVHDFHGNVSEEIVQMTTALITYKECPHLDARDRGVQAAHLMADVLAGRVKPTQAIVKPPMLYNIMFHNTFAAPLKAITDASKALEKMPKVLAASVAGGYQYADIPAMGPSVIVVTDNDPALAKREAERLAAMLWDLREKLTLKLPSPADAVREAMKADKFPVVFMDTGDNIGGGSSGDGTFILAELVAQKALGWAMTVADIEAVKAAYAAGVGGAFDMMVGGKTDDMHGKPVHIRGRVKTLTDGRFVEPEMRHGGGRYWDMGNSAVIEVEGSTQDLRNLLLLTPKRIIPFSIHQLTSVGIVPGHQRILVAKGTVAPRAAYEPVAAKIVEVDSAGVTAVNPARFTYQHVRPSLWGMK